MRTEDMGKLWRLDADIIDKNEVKEDLIINSQNLNMALSHRAQPMK